MWPNQQTTELIQMIGRKRLDDGEQVNVYVANMDEDTVKYRLSQANEWLEIGGAVFGDEVAHTQFVVNG